MFGVNARLLQRGNQRLREQLFAGHDSHLRVEGCFEAANLEGGREASSQVGWGTHHMVLVIDDQQVTHPKGAEQQVRAHGTKVGGHLRSTGAL